MTDRQRDVVAFGSKLDFLYLLASYYRAYVWLVYAYDTIGATFLCIATLVVVTLLAVYLRYRLYFCELLVREEPCTGILSVEPSQRSEYLSLQVQKAADYLASPLPDVTALLHIGHVVTGNIKIFCPHTMDAQLTACLAHHRIHLFYTFP